MKGCEEKVGIKKHLKQCTEKQLLLTSGPLVQEAVKGSQGAGRVDDALDSTIEGNEPVAEAVKPKGPARPAGAKGKKKGRR